MQIKSAIVNCHFLFVIFISTGCVNSAIQQETLRTPSSVSSIIECANEATRRKIVNGYPEYVSILCANAQSLAPITCAEEAVRTNTVRGYAEYVSVLCSGAMSNAPIECAKATIEAKIYSAPERVSALCAGAVDNEPIACAAEAIRTKVVAGYPEYVSVLCGKGIRPVIKKF